MTAAHAWRSASQGLLERRRSASAADGGHAPRTGPARPVAGAPWFPEDGSLPSPEDSAPPSPRGSDPSFRDDGASRTPEGGAAWFPEAPLPPGLLPLPSGFELRGA
ncbi:hypothetical protein ACFV06_17465 [Streptomyces sp. NPDC059618]|uniref:hypothetical protein n=1 Tax=Streptomyces sp. NPDC059618 TaxID=3346887 RepID=UPI0036BBE867